MKSSLDYYEFPNLPVTLFWFILTPSVIKPNNTATVLPPKEASELTFTSQIKTIVNAFKQQIYVLRLIGLVPILSSHWMRGGIHLRQVGSYGNAERQGKQPCTHTPTHAYTHTFLFDLKKSINLTYIFFGLGIRPDYPERTDTCNFSCMKSTGLDSLPGRSCSKAAVQLTIMPTARTDILQKNKTILKGYFKKHDFICFYLKKNHKWHV